MMADALFSMLIISSNGIDDEYSHCISLHTNTGPLHSTPESVVATILKLFDLAAMY